MCVVINFFYGDFLEQPDASFSSFVIHVRTRFEIFSILKVYIKYLFVLTEKERVSSHQVKTCVSILDGLEVVSGFFCNVFSGVACVDNGSIVCINSSIVSADGFS